MLPVTVLELVFAEDRNFFAQTGGISQLLHCILSRPRFMDSKRIKQERGKPFRADLGSRCRNQLKQRPLSQNVKVGLVEMLLAGEFQSGASFTAPVVFDPVDASLIEG
jgi:hypothetical protein